MPMTRRQPMPSAGTLLRRRLKQIPLLVQARKKLIELTDAALHPHELAIIRQLPLFSPNSWGASRARAQLTIQAANQTFPFIVRMLDTLGANHHPQPIDAGRFCDGEAARRTAAELKRKFDEYGSDKSSSHNYHLVYGPILKEREAVRALLEIGLGTNNTDVVSNMGRAGMPGASLRAFRDFLPAARIYGADVDRRILFQEARIKTFFVDQTDPVTFDDLGRDIGEELDLIIDDGLHSPNANLAALTFALERLRPGGWLVIEDIAGSALPLWQTVAALLPQDAYQTRIIATRQALVFTVRKSSGVAAQAVKVRCLAGEAVR